MTEFITVYDYLLLPPFLVLFYYIIRKRARRYNGTELRKYFITAFWLRMAGSILCGMLFQYYYGYGDTFGYYMGSDVITNLILKDITNLKVLFYSADDVVAVAKAAGFGEDVPINMFAESNITIMKISAIVSFFTFNKYLIICIVFGCISFIGTWKIFSICYERIQKKHGRLLAIAILYMPSLWIWGGGLLKEPICIGAFGLIIHILYKTFVKNKFAIIDLFYILPLLVILTIVKSYITAIFAASLSIMLFAQFMKSIKIKLFRYATLIMLGFGLVMFVAFADTDALIQPVIDASFDRIESFKNSYLASSEEDESSKGGFLVSGACLVQGV